MAVKELICGEPVIWRLLPQYRFILKNFLTREDGIHVAVIVEDKAHGIRHLVPADELTAVQS